MNGFLKFVCGFATASFGLAGILAAQAPAVRPAQPAQPVPAIRAEAVSNAPADVIRDARPPAPAQGPAISAAAGDYVLSVADTLEMTIFREGDLATRSRIGSDGTVQLPLIGDVKVAGMTVRAAREMIRKRYDADYLVDPQVYLNVVDYARRGFTILGQVAKPSTYDFPGGKSLSLLEAVGMAGGFTRTADRGKVIVKRSSEGGGQQTIRLNAKKLAGEGKDSFAVQPGDVITVGESWF
jgi:polysaccharide export outer membrane protein